MFSFGGKQWFTILFFSIIVFSRPSCGYESMANEAEEYLESLIDVQNKGSNTDLGLNCESQEIINSLPEFEFSEDAINADFLEKKISIFTSKVDDISTVSSSGSEGTFPCSMSKFEYSAIRYYTSSGYRNINSSLRSQSKETYNKYQIVLKVINRALSKIKSYKGFVRRGTTLPSVDAINHSLPGRIVNYPAFTSTSSYDGWGGSHRFIIYSKTCRNIAPISSYKNEFEVLCPAGLEFRVLRLKTSNNAQTIYLMEEVDNEELEVDP